LIKPNYLNKEIDRHLGEIRKKTKTEGEMGVCSDGARGLSELPPKKPSNQAWFEMADTEFDEQQ